MVEKDGPARPSARQLVTDSEFFVGEITARSQNNPTKIERVQVGSNCAVSWPDSERGPTAIPPKMLYIALAPSAFQSTLIFGDFI